MPKVCTTVNLLDDKRRLVTLRTGDEIPTWALDRVTNPAVLATDEAVEPVTDEPTVPSAGAHAETVATATTDYSTLNKNALVDLCNERELDAKGNKPDLIERLESADKTAESQDDPDPDVWSLGVDELKALAEKRGVDIGEATSQVELATLLQAGE